ncbi:hypothetical protein BGX24_003857 [Mortierella sp. AD032]|nr:hypothetical protein BGX24_003857 [Mortierella sp. AD032]
MEPAPEIVEIIDDDDTAEEAIDQIVHVMAAGPSISAKVQGTVDEAIDKIDNLVRLATVEATREPRKRRKII